MLKSGSYGPSRFDSPLHPLFIYIKTYSIHTIFHLYIKSPPIFYTGYHLTPPPKERKKTFGLHILTTPPPLKVNPKIEIKGFGNKFKT